MGGNSQGGEWQANPVWNDVWIKSSEKLYRHKYFKVSLVKSVMQLHTCPESMEVKPGQVRYNQTRSCSGCTSFGCMHSCISIEAQLAPQDSDGFSTSEFVFYF
jgi:hypothetical protein